MIPPRRRPATALGVDFAEEDELETADDDEVPFIEDEEDDAFPDEEIDGLGPAGARGTSDTRRANTGLIGARRRH